MTKKIARESPQRQQHRHARTPPAADNITWKVAICFLIVGDILCKDVWHEWLSNSDFIITCHAKNCPQKTRDWLEAHGATIVEEVATEWGKPSIAVAMRSVFSAAFKRGAQHACLVSQASIPFVSAQKLTRMCSLLKDTSAFKLRISQKIAAPLLKKYKSIRPAEQFCVLSAAGFRAVDMAWDTYFKEFSRYHSNIFESHESLMAMDEVFFPAMLHILNQPIENRGVTYSLWETGGSRAAVVTKAFVKQSLPAILQSKVYLFGRKFDCALYEKELMRQLKTAGVIIDENESFL